MFSLLKLLRSVLRTLPSVCVCVHACVCVHVSVSPFVCACPCHHLCVSACMYTRACTRVCAHTSACVYVESLLCFFGLCVVLFLCIFSYSTVVLQEGDLGFLIQKFTLKPASQLHPGSLAVLIRYNQAQRVPSV